jgi:gamma-glutamylcyclotransferase (GGCT)/AIG2-like uncharacterized protein YtfP
MPYLFSYGSLQRESVQLDTFGRQLIGVADQLPGYAITQIPITDPKRVAIHGAVHYANVEATGNAQSHVSGTVLDVTDAELLQADGYEAADGYARVQLRMASGSLAWVYVFSKPLVTQGQYEG